MWYAVSCLGYMTYLNKNMPKNPWIGCRRSPRRSHKTNFLETKLMCCKNKQGKHCTIWTGQFGSGKPVYLIIIITTINCTFVLSYTFNLITIVGLSQSSTRYNYGRKNRLYQKPVIDCRRPDNFSLSTFDYER